jgi:hypothetical protein
MYIKDLSCISPQSTYEPIFPGKEAEVHQGTRYLALEPSYQNLIPAGLLRRMGKAVRMGVGAGLPLLRNHPDLEGIILATANGGLEDCLRFLNQIVDYEEGTLTPTNFVQSTPNAVAGNLALLSKNTGYNITHVNKGLAFESALLDAMLLLEEGKAQSLLLGSIEEISDYNYNIDYLIGLFKEEAIRSDQLLDSSTKGTVCGEGAAMFVVEATKSAEDNVRIRDVGQISYTSEEGLVQYLNLFLQRNKLSLENIDAVILGRNGDSRTDHWYDLVSKNLNETTGCFTFKNLVGDYPTVASFAVWMGVRILKGESIPIEACYKKTEQKVKNILIYNHHKGVQHGFILLSAK